MRWQNGVRVSVGSCPRLQSILVRAVRGRRTDAACAGATTVAPLHGVSPCPLPLASCPLPLAPSPQPSLDVAVSLRQSVEDAVGGGRVLREERRGGMNGEALEQRVLDQQAQLTGRGQGRGRGWVRVNRRSHTRLDSGEW